LVGCGVGVYFLVIVTTTRSAGITKKQNISKAVCVVSIGEIMSDIEPEGEK